MDVDDIWLSLTTVSKRFDVNDIWLHLTTVSKRGLMLMILGST